MGVSIFNIWSDIMCDPQKLWKNIWWHVHRTPQVKALNLWIKNCPILGMPHVSSLLHVGYCDIVKLWWMKRMNRYQRLSYTRHMFGIVMYTLWHKARDHCLLLLNATFKIKTRKKVDVEKCLLLTYLPSVWSCHWHPTTYEAWGHNVFMKCCLKYQRQVYQGKRVTGEMFNILFSDFSDIFYSK